MPAPPLPTLPLNAAGLVALADLVPVARRTALTGTSALLDSLVLCPGLHRQQAAPALNAAEYPICAALTTGYVFRVENPATVAFLQTVGRAGRLTTVKVAPRAEGVGVGARVARMVYDWEGASVLGTTCYLLCALLTGVVVALLVFLRDWWALAAVGILVLARLINVLVLRRRAVEGWKGEPEAHAKSDLIVLLSQDRWVRMQGDVNDVKAVTSGAWLREMTVGENAAVAFATLTVYLDAALAGNGSTEGKLLLLILLFASAGLLGLCNEYTEVFKMYGRTIKMDGARKAYQRRLKLADALIEETGRTDWAVRLGMVNSNAVPKRDSDAQGPQTGSGAQRADENEEQVVTEL